MYNFLRFNKTNLKLYKRLYTTNALNMNKIKYTDTINLPKTKFPQKTNVKNIKEIQNKIYAACFTDLYKWQRNKCKSLTEFILHDGPPYANGDLHMGHAVNKIIKDITIRYNIINNIQVHYKPGWDCHGLPLELRVLASHKDLTPIEIRKKARLYALNAIENHKNDFQSWGITADWNSSDNIYRTLDVSYIKNQFKIFYDLYEKNLVYRDLKPVFWSPSSKTALAEAELEYNNTFISPSLTLRLKVLNNPSIITQFLENNNNNNSSVYAIIWTTTPWTLPANQAICYNQDLDYSLVKFQNNDKSLYIVASKTISQLSNLINESIEEVLTFSGALLKGTTYLHPIDNTDINPFLSGKHVRADKGTGLVHTAPAHGPDDFLVSLEHNIKMKCIIDELGKYTMDAPDFLQNKYVLDEGNNSVLEFIETDIIHLDKIQHSYPIDWRTKEPVIIRASQQWFINTEKLKKNASNELKNVNIFPKNTSEASKTSLLSQLEKRPYWCISRQRSWGTPIPVFYSKIDGSVIINEQIIQHLCKLLTANEDTDLWWSGKVEDLLSQDILSDLNIPISDIEKGTDILDIWFDSGISWSYALEPTKIADVYIEGYDQFTGWFQSSLMTSCAVREKAPYKSIFVHGFAVDEKGLKMSKSIGNVIAPKEIIEKYGIDALRWWTAAHATQHTAIPVSYQMLQSSMENLQKIRNTLRFFIGFVGKDEINDDLNFNVDNLQMLDKYFLNSLILFEKDIDDFYKTYQYNRVTAAILHWIVNIASGIYFNLIKDRLYCGTDEQCNDIKNVLRAAFYILNKTLWPIAPFLIEECWSYYGSNTMNNCVPYYKSVPLNIPSNWVNTDTHQLIEKCIQLRSVLHQSLTIITPWTIDLVIEGNNDVLKDLQLMHPKISEKLNDSELCEFLQVNSINLILNENLDNYQLHTSISNEIRCSRCRRYTVTNIIYLCNRCKVVLATKVK